MKFSREFALGNLGSHLRTTAFILHLRLADNRLDCPPSIIDDERPYETRGRLLYQHVQLCYQMIRDFDDPVSVLRRRELLGVSRARYYQWLTRGGKTVVGPDIRLLERIPRIHRRWFGHGFRCMHRLLERDSVRVPQRRVRHLMRLHGFSGIPVDVGHAAEISRGMR